jgi:hypothetical protein
MTAQPLAVPFFGAVLSDDDKSDFVAVARHILTGPEQHSDQILRDACSVLQTWGDGSDQLLADQMIFALNRKMRMDAAALAQRLRRDETPADVVREHADKWPWIVLAGGGLAVILLAFTGWL